MKKPKMRVPKGSGDQDGGRGTKKIGKGLLTESPAFSSPPNFNKGKKGSGPKHW